MIDNNIKSKIVALRQKAEEMIGKTSSKASSKLSETDALKLVHELQVHQIELEMQNKELTLAKNELESSKKNLQRKIDDLESFHRIAIDRELKMIELKKRIAELEKNSRI